MTTRADFTANGIDPVGAYMAGEDAKTKRARDTAVFDTQQAHAGQINRGLTLANDDSERVLDRARTSDAGNDQLAASMAGQGASPAAAYAPSDAAQTQGSGLAMGAPTTAPSSAAQAPGAGLAAGAPAPTPAPPSASQTEAMNKRAQARLLTNQGKFEAANKLTAEATTADQKHIFDTAAANADIAGAWDTVTKEISAKDTSITFSKDSKGRDVVAVQQPNGTATTSPPLTPADKRVVFGAIALMKSGFSSEALGLLSKVDAHLATELQFRSKQQMEVSAANNKTAHEESADESARIAAIAHSKMADAAIARVNMEKVKQSFGAPVNVVDKEGNAVVMQPYMVNGKMTFEKVELPDGARFPKQAPEQKFEKTGDGAGIMRSASTGNILFRVADNTPLPAEVNPFAGKEGEKTAAEWKSQGVTQGVTRLPDGTMKYFYESAASPADPQTGAGTWSTPQEAAAAGKTAQAKGSAMKGPKWPVAGAGRGLTSPPMAGGSSASGEDDYDAASQQADMARSKLDRSKAFARGQVRAPTAQPGTGIALE